MHKAKKKKKREVAVKIDLEKAYDNVDWGYLNGCLEDFGFPGKIINLIMFFVSSSSLSIIWNGKRLPKISPSRGLWQRDPLSPYLFALCMEKLSIAINEVVQAKRWQPIKVFREGPSFSRLFFANEVRVFSKATSTQASVIADFFHTFSLHFGLKVNIAKSRAFISSGSPGGRWKPSPLLLLFEVLIP